MNRHPLAKTAYLVVAFIILGAFGWSVHAKEELIRTGQTVLVELAPADPRSLMQGDYMRLNYRIADEAEKAHPYRYNEEAPRYGYVVLAAEPQEVARYVRVDDGKEMLGPNEYRLRFHRKYSQVNIVPNSYMFEEGQGSNYARAKYGIFKFDRSGHTVLTGLADENRQLIEPITAKAVLP